LHEGHFDALTAALMICTFRPQLGHAPQRIVRPISGPTMSPKLTNKTIGGSQKKQTAASTKIPSAMMSPVKKPDIGAGSDVADANSRCGNWSIGTVALVCLNCRAASAAKKSAAAKNAKTVKPIANPPTKDYLP
jgi:hypothetical protein